jgi:hypothetical protein
VEATPTPVSTMTGGPPVTVTPAVTSTVPVDVIVLVPDTSRATPGITDPTPAGVVLGPIPVVSPIVSPGVSLVALSGGGDTEPGTQPGQSPTTTRAQLLPRSEFALDTEASGATTPLSRILGRGDGTPNDSPLAGLPTGGPKSGGGNADALLVLGQTDLKASLLGSSVLGADDSVWTIEAVAAAAVTPVVAGPPIQPPPDLWKSLAANAAAQTTEPAPDETPSQAPESSWYSWRSLMMVLGTAAVLVLVSPVLRRLAKSWRTQRNLRPTLPIPTTQRNGPASA